MKWQPADLDLLWQYWHTEPERVTARRLGRSRGAVYMQALRLYCDDAEFRRLIRGRQDNYIFDVVGEIRRETHVRTWTNEQFDALRQWWHVELNTEVAARVGKSLDAVVAMAGQLRDREPEFAAALIEREPAYHALVNRYRTGRMAAVRWAGHQKVPKVKIKREKPDKREQPIFVRRFLEKSPPRGPDRGKINF